ncbi:testis-expressed protein 9 [Linepithema humile]|uniref:testis-expressed protein 9 n=1 Tax=Linepithema humile TaxID=83485 RepID=UPI00351E3358
MSDDLLAKEKEFRRLNRELQLKTRDVMKEVDSIIHACASNNLFSNTNQSHLDLVTKDVKVTEDVTSKLDKHGKTSLMKTPETSSIENLTNVQNLSKKDNNLGNRAVVNLLKGKIDMLYKELQAMQFEYNKKCDYSKELEAENKKLEDAQVKLYNQIATLKDTITKLENIKFDALSSCQTLNNENVVLKKDLEDLRKEVKTLNQQSINYDVRLNRSLETNEKLRTALKCNQIEEKELRNQIRKLQEDKRLAVKTLEKQRSELVQAFKKQMLLIDNLKKQNMYLTGNGQICLMEEDFAKLLEWKPQQL